MKKIILILFIAVIYLCSNNIFASGSLRNYSLDYIGFDAYLKENYSFVKPELINIATLCPLYYKPELVALYGDYEYEFIWDSIPAEGTYLVDTVPPYATYWVRTYRDSADHTNLISIAGIFPANSSKHYVTIISPTITSTAQHINGFKFGDKDATSWFGVTAQTANKFFEDFAKFNNELKSAAGKIYTNMSTVPVPDNITFAFGAGYIEEIGYKDASEYGIPPNLPIYYALVYDMSDGTWQFCYTEIGGNGELHCLDEKTDSIEEPAIIKNYSLFPNPASDDCTLSMDMTEAGSISISLSDMLGRDIMQIYDGYAEAGAFSKAFNTKHLANGVYSVVFRIGDKAKAEKLIINR